VNQWLGNDGIDVAWEGIALNNLSNVIVPTPATGNVLTWNGSAWINQATTVATLDDIGDVNIPSATTNTGILWSGTEWVNATFGTTAIATNAITLEKMAHATDQGSIITFTTVSETPTYLSAGTEGQVLTAHGLADLTWEDASVGDMVLADLQTVTGIKIYNNDILQFNTPTPSGAQYKVQTNTITADRDIILPLLTASATFVFDNFAQPLTNKTIDADLNTITDISDNEIKTGADIALAKIIGTAVNLTTIQIITAQKNIEDLVCGTTNFQCLDTSPDFQANSIDGNDLQDNTVSLAQFIHFTGGSIITFTSGNVPAYLLAGKEGQILTAHGADTALSWEEINQGVQDAGFQTVDQSLEFEFDANWISNTRSGYGVTDNNVNITEDTTLYVPVWVGRRCKVTNLGFNNIGGSTGTMTIEMGLYSNRTDGTNYPETRLESDSFSATAGTEFHQTDSGFVDENIEAGLYWIAFNPVNIPVGSIMTITGYSAVGATLALHYDDQGGTQVMLACTGFATTDTTLPITADSDMTPFNEGVGALYMQVVPNTA
jgi:hypothetical protein